MGRVRIAEIGDEMWVLTTSELEIGVSKHNRSDVIYMMVVKAHVQRGRGGAEECPESRIRNQEWMRDEVGGCS